MRASRKARLRALKKSPTGITGLDEITGGGLPAGRTTLVCGGPGCGKTILGMQFLVHGAALYREAGVFVSFEESAEDLVTNMRSLGFDIDDLVARKRIHIDVVRVEQPDVPESGEYDLEGLFIRLGHAIDSIGASRVVLDTVETLFGGISNHVLLRSELNRLFRWLKDRGVTAILTGEQGSGSLTRHGLEEYVSDCVLLLDHRVQDQISSRRLRIMKYRGSTHGTNEYPFLIDADGLSVLPVTSLGLKHKVSTQRVSSGISGLDKLLGGRGYYQGSSVLISGTAGTGKSSTAAHFVDAACRRRERALYFSFEESPSQIMRNMKSIGIDLGAWVKKGLLLFQAARPTSNGLEMHLVMMHKIVQEFKPDVVVVDPLTSFTTGGNESDVRVMLTRLVDFLKTQGITGLFSSLTSGGAAAEHTDVAISSLIDTWLMIRMREETGERRRELYVLKSRGMAHSSKVVPLIITKRGMQLANQGGSGGDPSVVSKPPTQGTSTDRRNRPRGDP